MTTGASLGIRTTLAEICTGNRSSARSCRCPRLCCLQLFSPRLFSALTQFFQIFPEYQSNEFYATGEVRFCHFSFFLACSFLHLNINTPTPAVLRGEVRSCHFLLHPQKQPHCQGEDQPRRNGHRWRTLWSRNGLFMTWFNWIQPPRFYLERW